MKSLASLVLFLMFSIGAAAQTTETGSTAGQLGIVASPPTKTVGRPHLCNGWYPISALLAGKTGVTTLSFTIQTDGSISDIGVQESSGTDDLDEAAAACARYWHYIPATKNNEPIATPWKAKIVWDASRMCAPFYSGPPVDFKTISGASVLAFDIEGSRLASLGLRQSSGNDALDAAARTCLITQLGEVHARHAVYKRGIMEVPWKSILRPHE